MNFSYPFIRRPVGTTLLAIGLFLVGAVAYRSCRSRACPPSICRPSGYRRASPAPIRQTIAATVAAPLERRLGEIAGRDRDHLAESRSAKPRSRCSSISTATSTAPRATCRRRINAAANDLPSDLPQQPTFRKVNPAAAPVLILALTSKTIPASAIYDAADTVVAQRILQVDGRGRCHGQRRRTAGHPRPRQSGARRPRPASRSTTCAPRSSTPTRKARSASSTAMPGPRRSPPTTSCAPSRTIRHLVVKAKNGNIVQLRRHRQHRASDAQQPTRRLVQPAAGGAADRHQAGQRQRHRHGRPYPRAAARDQALDPGRHRHLGPVRPHRDHTGERARHAGDARRRIGAGDAGGVPVPAARRADASPPALPCRCRSPAPAPRCGWSGFSIDNLSLMALAVSVGFVVDDAIVMIENTFRNLEKGHSPLRATIEGAHQIGFTVISISISLIAAFIPLLFMGGIVGPLLPRILGHTGVRDRNLDRGIADGHADDLRALHSRNPEPQRDALRSAGRGRARRLVGTTERPCRRAATSRVMLMVMAATVVITVDLYYKIPKGYFPAGRHRAGVRREPRLARRFVQDHGRAAAPGRRIVAGGSGGGRRRLRRSAASASPARSTAARCSSA